MTSTPDPGAAPAETRRPPFAVRIVLIVLGSIALALGLVGVVIRGIPTTPLLLLAAACFSRGSQRMHSWLTNHRHLGPILYNLKSGRGMTLRLKVMTLVLAWTLLLTAAFLLFDAGFMRYFLIGLCVAKLIAMIAIPTYRPERELSLDVQVTHADG